MINNFVLLLSASVLIYFVTPIEEYQECESDADCCNYCYCAKRYAFSGKHCFPNN